jgi:hypothetical protein
MQHRRSGFTRLPLVAAVGLAAGAVIACAARPGLGQAPVGAPGATAQAASVDVDAFLTDPMKLLGSQVTLTGCRAAGFISDSIGCYPRSGQGRVPIDAGTFDRASLRRALKHCTDAGPLTACQISVSGLVETDAMQKIRLKNAVAASGDVGTP